MPPAGGAAGAGTGAAGVGVGQGCAAAGWGGAEGGAHALEAQGPELGPLLLSQALALGRQPAADVIQGPTPVCPACPAPTASLPLPLPGPLPSGALRFPSCTDLWPPAPAQTGIVLRTGSRSRGRSGRTGACVLGGQLVPFAGPHSRAEGGTRWAYCVWSLKGGGGNAVVVG